MQNSKTNSAYSANRPTLMFNRMPEAHAATVDRIVGNARLAACKPADALKTADEANDATAGSVDKAALDIGKGGMAYPSTALKGYQHQKTPRAVAEPLANHMKGSKYGHYTKMSVISKKYETK